MKKFLFLILTTIFAIPLSAQDFRVQIGAYAEKMDHTYFKDKGLENYIESTDQLGVYRYFAGMYTTRDEADKRLAEIKDLFPNALIIDIEEQRILCGQGCPYFRNGQIYMEDPKQTTTNRTIYFDFGRYSLTQESKDELNIILQTMKTSTKATLKILGYADAIGSAEANIKLSTNRARAARNYLINKGIRADRMFIKVFGEADPALPNKDEDDDKTDAPENRKWNRRVALIVVDEIGEVKTDDSK